MRTLARSCVMQQALKFVMLVLALGNNSIFGQVIYAPGGTVGNISGSSVGIGTASPTRLLSLNGASNAYLGFKVGDTGQSTIGSDANGDFFVYDDQDSTYRLVVDPDGDVGIGTTSPSGRLHVLGFSNYQGTVIADVSSAGYSSFGLYQEGTFKASIYWHPSIQGVQFYGSSKWIYESGSVGIGTANLGTHKLAVNGSIHAKEVVVDNIDWPDFVFADDYRLTPLSEVEAHIKAERHLPGIPSAAEVAAGGVGLGDMQARLLAKVEELTLHQIAQEKRLTEQAGRIQRLEAENAALRMR